MKKNNANLVHIHYMIRPLKVAFYIYWLQLHVGLKAVQFKYIRRKNMEAADKKQKEITWIEIYKVYCKKWCLF